MIKPEITHFAFYRAALKFCSTCWIFGTLLLGFRFTKWRICFWSFGVNCTGKVYSFTLIRLSSTNCLYPIISCLIKKAARLWLFWPDKITPDKSSSSRQPVFSQDGVHNHLFLPAERSFLFPATRNLSLKIEVVLETMQWMHTDNSSKRSPQWRTLCGEMCQSKLRHDGAFSAEVGFCNYLFFSVVLINVIIFASVLSSSSTVPSQTFASPATHHGHCRNRLRYKLSPSLGIHPPQAELTDLACSKMYRP